MPKFPFDTIKGAIENLLRGFDRVLTQKGAAAKKSDWSFLVLRMLLRLNENTYQAIRFLCSDNLEEKGGEKEFSLSTPAMARTILDTVFYIVWILYDPESRTMMYMRSGWATIQAELKRWAENHPGDPLTDPELKAHQQGFDQFKNDYSITPEEEANPKLIDPVPHPGGLIRMAETNAKYVLDTDRLEFLKLLNHSFYGSFSEDSHMKWPSAMLRGATFLHPSKEERVENLDVLRQDYFTKTVIFIITLLSEIELNLKCGFSDELKYVWAILSNNTDAARIYEFRYKSRL